MPTEPRPLVLIVDDDEEIARILSFTLENNGFATASAYDGPDGMRQGMDRSFDLFVIDQMMPGMLGIEVAHQLTLRGRASRDRIVLITAGPIPSRAADYVFRVLRKPFDLEEFVPLLRSMVHHDGPPVA
jgi:CheY-like chemotaxis protein